MDNQHDLFEAEARMLPDSIGYGANNQHDLFEAETFIDGLRKARRGVVLVESEGSHTTAWFITNNLIVVPSFFFTNQPPPVGAIYQCYHQPSGPQPLEAHLVEQAVGNVAGLLRINKTVSNCALPLATGSPRQGDSVFALQHTVGHRRLSFSIGELTKQQEDQLEYTAATVPGSAGSPLLNASWAVVGTHESKWLQPQTPINRGISIPAILDSLHGSVAWAEIVLFHRLVEFAGFPDELLPAFAALAPVPASAVLHRAAVHWQFRPALFSEAEQILLRPLVLDAKAANWMLTVEERQRVLVEPLTLAELRAARGTAAADHPGQRVIDQVLAGPPYALAQFTEDHLPYLLQVVRWFSKVIPTLPKPKEINDELERRRIRSRLMAIAGPTFRGRAAELRELRGWYENPQAGPLLLTGVGGVGKSALLAQFVTTLPSDTLLLWLDFDRPDLAPNNALSVLTLLGEQLKLQRKEVTVPEFDLQNWQLSATRFAQALASVLSPADRPLLVLDGFEVAQYATGYNEIWELLNLLLAVVPAMRVAVSGRAEVPQLMLQQRPAQPLRLQAMTPAEARAWLQEKGISDPSLQQQVLSLSRGIPLMLRLTLQLFEEKQEMPVIPANLSEVLVEGMLYQRILHRLGDHSLLHVAQDVLVLRYVTEDLLAGILADSLPPGLSAREAFSQLARELSIISEEPDAAGFALSLPAGKAVLYVRPEVRRVTLALLEAANPERVRQLDLRAARWYQQQDQSRADYAAELIYHSLRTGSFALADEVWRDACARLLRDALPDFEHASSQAPVHQAYTWLAAHINRAVHPVSADQQWEAQMLVDIPRMIAQGDTVLAFRYLHSNSTRQPHSVLVLYDAWLAGRDNPAKGRKLLGSLATVTDSIGRDRALLGAYLASKTSGRQEAHRLLSHLSKPALWRDVPYAALALLAIKAAQIRLTVDLAGELTFAQQLQHNPDAANSFVGHLSANDVVLPSLGRRLGWGFRVESARTALHLPLLDKKPSSWQGATELLEATGSAVFTSQENAIDQIGNLARWRHRAGREWLFTETTWKVLFTPDSFQNPLAVAIISTLAAFRGQPMSCTAWQQSFPALDYLLQHCTRNLISLPASQRPIEQAALAMQVLRAELAYLDRRDENLPGLARLVATTKEEAKYLRTKELVLEELKKQANLYSRHPELTAISLYLLGPEPLEMLCRLTLNLPAHLAL